MGAHRGTLLRGTIDAQDLRTHSGSSIASHINKHSVHLRGTVNLSEEPQCWRQHGFLENFCFPKRGQAGVAHLRHDARKDLQGGGLRLVLAPQAEARGFI